MRIGDMMMEHLNYCRQATKPLQEAERAHSDEVVRRECGTALNAMAKAAKFMLPDGGRLLPDAELRGLEGSEFISLPFPVLAIEYRDSGGGKRITLATQREEDIFLQHVLYFKCEGWTDHQWIVTCGILLSRSHPVTRLAGNACDINVIPLDSELDCEDDLAKEPAAALLSMLNALACSNVHIERSEPKKAGKKIKSALPFDTYHLLTIDAPGRAGSAGEGAETGGHRSPREHLRRGHIRRLADDRRIWVNATVVAACRGAGVVTKDYAVRCADAKDHKISEAADFPQTATTTSHPHASQRRSSRPPLISGVRPTILSDDMNRKRQPQE